MAAVCTAWNSGSGGRVLALRAPRDVPALLVDDEGFRPAEAGSVEAARPVNDALLEIGRELARVLYTSNGPYRQHPALHIRCCPTKRRRRTRSERSASPPSSSVKAAIMSEDVARGDQSFRTLFGPVWSVDPVSIDAVYDRYQNVYGQR
jgi:hypothetical protein